MSPCNTESDDDIVITGMSGQFPNSRSAKEYIDQLLNKVNLCDEDERRGKIDHPEIPKLGGRLWEVELFDPGSFGIHAFQSIYTDPMGRIFLEQVYQALFDAGIHPDELKGTKTGVFTGGCASEYELCFYKGIKEDNNIIPGATRSMNAQRVSYCLQVNGPAMNLDTACSSGMYALDAAYNAIRQGRCDQAIVGGTNLCLDPYLTLQFARLGVLNIGGGCRPFDNDATGYTRSEAIVAMVLQKRPEAKRIYAKLVHAKANADGFKSQGITFPSFDGQLAVLKEVYSEGKVDPKEIGFLEAHGTGTRVGDPEELTVIDEFFKPTKEAPLMIGSVKGNIGHTEPSAGLCSMVKVMHALNTGQIAPNIHYDKPREGVSALAEQRLKVLTEVTPFPKDKKYAGVNSFGFGGGNAHAIVERYFKINPERSQPVKSRLVCYSGRTQAALDTIHDEIAKCKDVEYLGLLQESFKTNIDTHLYRGYTIVGKNVRSSMKAPYSGDDKIKLIIGNFTSAKCIENLKQIPLLKSILEQNKGDPKVVLLQAFKGLCLPVEPFTSTKPEVIEEWIKSTSIYSYKGTIVLLGNATIPAHLKKKCNLITFGDDLKEDSFLCNVGKLYELGFQPQVYKLYPRNNYPVSAGTDMLGHLLKWKHKPINMIRWAKDVVFQAERVDVINAVNKDHAYIRGHMIDNRNLFPATGYIIHVWNLYADLNGLYSQGLGVVFENLRFHRACTLTDIDLELYIVVEHNGNFEVSENGATVVTGRIQRYDEKTEGSEAFITDEEEQRDSTADQYILTAKDAYRELRLRGYNYGGLFRAIEEVTPTVATIKWDNNWVTFLDNMMQVCILNQDTRSLYVPVGLERLVLRAQNHMDYVNAKEDKLVTVRFFKDCMTVRSKYIEMRGLNAKSIARRKERLVPVLENYQFVPNDYTTNLATSVRINIQLLLESKQTVSFTVAELVGDDESEDSVITNQICNAIEDLPLVIPDMTIITKKEGLEVPNCKIEAELTEPKLLLVCKQPCETLFDDIDKYLIPDGFMMCFCSKEQSFPESLVVLTKHTIILEENSTKYPIVYFLRKRLPAASRTITIDISNSEDMSWLWAAQDAMKTDAGVVLVAQNNYKNGILGFTNCLNKEPGSDKVSCIFLQDKSVQYDENNNANDAVQKQLNKQMKINVFMDGQWGTYRHLLLSDSDKVLSHHWFAKTLNPGDLSTLCWTQGPIRPEHQAKMKIMYAALNFRDLMLASGKLSPEAITTDRLIQDRLQGFEYVGYDNKGKRVCSMGAGGISNLAQDCHYMLEIPDHLSMEDAATVLVVYSTVMFGLIHRADLQKGQSILIHSGTGGVGLSALNVCSYFNCDIFVTVGTQEKRDFLREHYPHIKSSHIGSSRDTSFKEMIMRETNGRGVDIVLNSLAEEKLLASVQCLAHGGSFVEIGKYDLDKNNGLCLDLAMRECRHIGVMLDSCLMDQSCSGVLHTLWANAFRDGYIKPLPRTIFEMDELDKAFKYLSTGKHIGKVMIRIDHEKEHKVLPRYYCDPSKSYILFGGLGGFGLELADWLVVRGAKHIILSSRTGITTGYQRYRIAIWQAYGVKVTILMENIIDYDTCYKALKDIHAIAPIDGIFNLAVVLKDAIFEHQTIETMKVSMEPKAILTEHLDKITRQLCPKMSTFVVFSSVSCGRGNGGQTNYGYSNSVMERICEQRHAAGFPALAVQWGAIGDVGLLEALQKEHNEIAIGGTLQQKVGNCLAVFDELLLSRCPIVSSIVVAEKFNKRSADSPIEAVCRILGVQDVKSVSPHTCLPELGMDSMMAVEIKQTLERDFEVSLTPNDLRSLTFAKLEEMSSRSSEKPDAAMVNTNSVELTMLIPGIQLATSKEQIVDFNQDASKCKGDFILAFPGVDADYRAFEIMSNKMKTHMKVISYDSITLQQKNVDVIVDYLFKTLKDEIKSFKSFKFLAHSIGNFAAIELMKRFEAINIRGKLILLDGAPDLMYSLFELIKGKSQDDLECNMIEGLVQTTMPHQDITNLRETLLQGKNYAERVELMMAKYFDHTEIALVDQIRSLMFSFESRMMSIPAYQTRPQNDKLASDVLLYKPTVVVIKNISEDYNLSALCEKAVRVETYEGNHLSMLLNDKLHKQLSIEFEIAS